MDLYPLKEEDESKRCEYEEIRKKREALFIRLRQIHWVAFHLFYYTSILDRFEIDSLIFILLIAREG